MSDDRKNSTAGFWVSAILLAVLLGYPLSFGPACWISSRLDVGSRLVTVAYRPITWGLSENYDGRLDGAIRWYARLGAADNGWDWWNVLNDGGEWEWRRLLTM